MHRQCSCLSWARALQWRQCSSLPGATPGRAPWCVHFRVPGSCGARAVGAGVCALLAVESLLHLLHCVRFVLCVVREVALAAVMALLVSSAQVFSAQWWTAAFVGWVRARSSFARAIARCPAVRASARAPATASVVWAPASLSAAVAVLARSLVLARACVGWVPGRRTVWRVAWSTGVFRPAWRVLPFSLRGAVGAPSSSACTSLALAPFDVALSVLPVDCVTKPISARILAAIATTDCSLGSSARCLATHAQHVRVLADRAVGSDPVGNHGCAQHVRGLQATHDVVVASRLPCVARGVATGRHDFF